MNYKTSIAVVDFANIKLIKVEALLGIDDSLMPLIPLCFGLILVGFL